MPQDTEIQTVVVTAKRLPPVNDDVTILVDGLQLGGWTSVQITRGLERMPSSFELIATERYPLNADALQVTPGSPCQVLIGSDVIVTGYVDRVIPSYAGGQHSVTLSGRGKCCDLVDCAAEWPGQQFSNVTVFDIARSLAEPYGISVEARGDIGAPIPKYNFGFGQTAWSIIEEWARVRQLVVYERPDGNLQMLFADASGTKSPFPPAASGFAEGVNIESAHALWDTGYRYSEYQCSRVSMNPLQALSQPGRVGDEDLIAIVKDPGIKRHRVFGFVLEQGSPLGYEAGRRRAQWEAVRRFGRAGQVRLVTDAWRDAMGVLYDIGTSVSVDSPSLKVGDSDRLGAPWVIAEIQYVKNDTGTHANVMLMQRHAFDPQPTTPPQYHVPAEFRNLPANVAKP
jgi:prophage tail gpP-like protein